MAVDLAERISSALRRGFSGDGYRHQSPNHEPLSGEGARLHGGRFNPPSSYPVLYLCTTRVCAIAEFHRFADRHPIGAAGFLPRVLFRYDLELTSTLDLTDDATLQHLGIDPAHLIDQDWAFTNQIGELAHQFGYQGIINPSATGVDRVVAIFTDKLRTGRVAPVLEETWATLDDLY